MWEHLIAKHLGAWSKQKPNPFKIVWIVSFVLFEQHLIFLNLGANETSDKKLNWILRKGVSNKRHLANASLSISAHRGEHYFGFQPHYALIHKAWYKNFKPQMFLE